jgi:large subunit ribosomal protein L32
MRHTRSHTRNRRSHHALTAVVFNTCKKCGTTTTPHTVCENCGTYRGRMVIDVLKKLNKKERKQKEKTLKEEEVKTQTTV